MLFAAEKPFACMMTIKFSEKIGDSKVFAPPAQGPCKIEPISMWNLHINGIDRGTKRKI